MTDFDQEPGTLRRILLPFGYVLLLGLGRALALALAVFFLSDVRAAFLAGFLTTWTGLFFLPMALLALLELPVSVASVTGPRRRVKAAVVAMALAVLWGVLMTAYWPLVRSLGDWTLVAMVIGSLPALAVPQGRPRRPRLWYGVAAVLIGGPLLALVVLDPEGQYNERYQDNRLSEEDLAKDPLFPDRSPEDLSDTEVARALAHTWMQSHSAEELRWSWEETVAVEGLLQLAAVTGDEAGRRFARSWIDAHHQHALEVTLWADTCAPGIVILGLPEKSAKAKDAVILKRIEEYLRQAPRTTGGALSHAGNLMRWMPQAWVDSLFMHGVFLNRWYRVRDDDWGRKEAQRLFTSMARALQDEETGLYRHALFEAGPLTVRLPVEDCFWARGNAWVLYFLVDHQMVRRAQGLEPEPAMQQALQQMADTLLEAQSGESGLWRTDLLGDAADNPLETSASALITAALERARAGDLLEGDKEYHRRLEEQLDKAYRGLRKQLQWQDGHPRLVGTSLGTHPGFRRYYRHIPTDENVGHGVGAFLLAFAAREAALD